MALEDNIFKFFEVWGAKLGDSALDAVRNAVGYENQEVELQIDPNLSGVTFNSDKSITYKLAFNKEYWRYIQSGVNGTENNRGSIYSFKKEGKRIPITPLIGFIEKRGIRVKTTKGISIEKGRKSLAFALSTTIKKEGIKPRPFTDKILTKELNDELVKGISKIIGEDVIATFKELQ